MFNPEEQMNFNLTLLPHARTQHCPHLTQWTANQSATFGSQEPRAANRLNSGTGESRIGFRSRQRKFRDDQRAIHSGLPNSYPTVSSYAINSLDICMYITLAPAESRKSFVYRKCLAKQNRIYIHSPVSFARSIFAAINCSELLQIQHLPPS